MEELPLAECSGRDLHSSYISLIYFCGVASRQSCSRIDCIYSICHPSSHNGAKRNVIGGQTIGAGVGLVCSYLPFLSLQGGVAIALASFLMVTLDSEHPPAAGTALGLAIMASWEGAVFVLLASIALSSIRWALLDELEDLT